MSEKSILLVEDNKKDEVLILRALKAVNVANQIDVVRDGQAAVDYLLGQEFDDEGVPNELPALVILDLKLPKLDGHEVLQRLRAHPRTEFLPIVIMTSSDEEKDIVNSYRLGANSFVSKPVKFDDFFDAGKTLGLYWLLTNKSSE